MIRNLIIFILISLSVSIYAESPISGMFEGRFGWFMPNIDSEAALGDSKPYEKVFSDSGFQYGFEYGYNLIYHDLAGTLLFSFGMDYFKKEGSAVDVDGNSTSDITTLIMVPLKISLVYNIDQFEKLYNFPLIPYLKAGLQYKLWSITNSIGNTASVDGDTGSGAKKGYYWALGVRLLLDFMDPDSALDFDNDLGINNSYIFAEYLSSDVNNFGGKGLMIGGSGWFFGIALTF